MINWPQHLIAELAERSCIIFLGSGVSANAKSAEGKSPKTWEEFLVSATELVVNGEQKAFVENLIENKNYLLALQCIYDNSDSGDYIRFLKDEFLNPRYNPTQIHENIVEIDPKILITTNFDVIYEKASNDEGHTVVNYYDTNLIENLRSDQRVTIKAHGTIHNTNKLIFR